MKCSQSLNVYQFTNSLLPQLVLWITKFEQSPLSAKCLYFQTGCDDCSVEKPCIYLYILTWNWSQHLTWQIVSLCLCVPAITLYYDAENRRDEHFHFWYIIPTYVPILHPSIMYYLLFQFQCLTWNSLNNVAQIEDICHTLNTTKFFECCTMSPLCRK